MTHAVLFATAGARTRSAGHRCAALLPLDDGRTVVERLASQLRALGVARVVVLARPGEDAAALRQRGLAVEECRDVAEELRAVAEQADQVDQSDRAGRRLVLGAADLLAPDTVLRTVLGSAASATALISRELDGSPQHPPVHAQRGRLVRVAGSAGAPSGAGVLGGAGAGGAGRAPAGADFRGLLGVAPDRLRQALAGLAPETTGESLTAILTALAEGSEPVAVQRAPGLPYGRVASPEALAERERELRLVDEDQVRLRLAVKRRDDLFATYFVSSYSPYLVRWAARHGLTPTMVTWASVTVAALASAAFVAGGRGWLIAGALGLYVSFVLDCVDGQLARYLHRYGRFGGWLDAIADRGKEYLVYGALALGAIRSGIDGVWPLAIAAMVLLTVRHMSDTWYGALQDEAVRRTAAAPAEPGSVGRLGARLGEMSERVQSDRASLAYWVKRTLPFPIGERWLVLGLGTAVFDAKVAFVVLLGWGALAAAYTFGGRTLRSRHLRVPVLARRDHALYRDDGWLARRLGSVAGGRVPPLPAALLPVLVAVLAVLPVVMPASGVPLGYLVLASFAAAAVAALGASSPHTGSLDWLVPAALRAAEYAVVLLVAGYGGVPLWLLFALCGVLALYHYDLTARLEKAASPLRWRRLGLGWDGRLAVLAGAAAIDALAVGVPAVLPAAVAALTGYLGLVFVAGALLGLRRARGASSPPAPTVDPPGVAAASGQHGG